MTETLRKTLNWFEVARPEAAPNTFSVQFGVHCEEFAETLDAIDPLDDELAELIQDASKAVKELASALKKGTHTLQKDDLIRVDLLDGLCDTIVTAVGTAHALGMDIVGAMDEVNSSNFSKFENGKPVFKANGKIGKGINYTPPNLEPFIN